MTEILNGIMIVLNVVILIIYYFKIKEIIVFIRNACDLCKKQAETVDLHGEKIKLIENLIKKNELRSDIK